MAVFRNITTPTGEQPAIVEYDVASGGASTIKAGYPVVLGSGYVAAVANGATSMLGIAAGDSTDTAAADGKVLVYVAPVLKFTATATTPANLAQTTKGTKVTIDLSGSSFTADENDTSSGFVHVIEYDNTTDGNCECMAVSTL